MIYLLYAILIYLAYQFIFKLVVPLYIASRKIKKGFREMSERMSQQQMDQDNTAASSEQWNKGKKQNSPPSQSAGEYIEFEEIK